MITDIREIKEIRKKYGLTQSELAKIAGVSQSLIAKIESNMIDPAYSKIKQIFEAINKLQHKKEMKAKDVLNKNIIFLKASDTLKEATQVMKKKNISQLPVIDPKHKEVVIGMISEALILDAIMKKISPDSKVSEIMKDCPPIVAKDAEISMIGNLLKFYPMVIVKEKGKTIGIITKADLLGKVYK
ncbi:CBS domain-containing protein [Candidatus Woesearchaeota archaeon]|jgi:predicted transcriptional regulator|nr:CBS domain-containing protein [Candidatus Woesearchaeota archaeon]